MLLTGIQCCEKNMYLSNIDKWEDSLWVANIILRQKGNNLFPLIELQLIYNKKFDGTLLPNSIL